MFMSKNKKGFSIVELLFAIAIISLVIVMVVIFYTYMIKVSSKGVDISIATQVAEKKIEEIVNDSTTDGLKTKLINNYYKKNCIIGSEPVGDNIYYYLIYTAPMKGDYALMDLTLIDIFVFWWAPDNDGTNRGFNNDAKKDLENLRTKFLTLDNYSEYSNSDDFITKIEEGLTEDSEGNTVKMKNSVAGSNEGHKFIRLTRMISTPKS